MATSLKPVDVAVVGLGGRWCSGIAIGARRMKVAASKPEAG